MYMHYGDNTIISKVMAEIYLYTCMSEKKITLFVMFDTRK